MSWVHQLAAAPVHPIAFVPGAPTHRSYTISTLVVVPDYALFGSWRSPPGHPLIYSFIHSSPSFVILHIRGFIDLIFLLVRSSIVISFLISSVPVRRAHSIERTTDIPLEPFATLTSCATIDRKLRLQSNTSHLVYDEENTSQRRPVTLSNRHTCLIDILYTCTITRNINPNLHATSKPLLDVSIDLDHYRTNSVQVRWVSREAKPQCE